MLTYYLGLGSNKQEVRSMAMVLINRSLLQVHFLHSFFDSQIYPFYFICNPQLQI